MSHSVKTILTAGQLNNAVQDLANGISARYPSLGEIVFVGIQRGGVALADALLHLLKEKNPAAQFTYGQLDITFYRDDFRKEILTPDVMNIPFGIENRHIILIDDVLFTGRTIKAALDALLDYGRPARVELCVLIDRKEHRQFPIQADYKGIEVQTERTDKIKLQNGEVVLIKGADNFP